MMNEFDLNSTAASLLDGGWTVEDRDQIQTEYDLTEEETDRIVEEMARLTASQNKVKIYTVDAYNTLYCVPGTTHAYDSLADLEEYEGLTEDEYEIVDAPAGVDADCDCAVWPDAE